MKHCFFQTSFVLSLMLCSLFSNAQIFEAGVHFGYNPSKFKLEENRLSNEIFIREGVTFSGGTFGIQYMLSPPKQQNVAYFKIIPSVLFELSFCRCGGNVELITSFPDGSRSFTELQYILYRGDYSVKYVANIKNFNFMIGPMFSNNFFSGVQLGVDSEELKYAGDQFSVFTVGYEFGAGIRAGQFLISARYNGMITPFGRETDVFPTAYKFKQYRIMLHYFLFRRHKGANWDSIYWK